MVSALNLYRYLATIGSPLVRIYLWLRKQKGKEDPNRINERFGHASTLRPTGTVWWLHAASVGEAISLKPLMEEIHKQAPEVHLLITTGTVSSANMLRDNLPDHIIHQYVPVDTPAACKRFIDYWQPSIAIFTESEIWPNLIMQAKKAHTKLALINARMSEKSFGHWRLLDEMIATLLGSFSLIAAQTKKDADRFSELGGKDIKQLGHLKQDAGELPVDETELNAWKNNLHDRPCLVAASFHPGEVDLVGRLHQALKSQIPNLLTILVPRHPPKAPAMRELLESNGLHIQMRSTDATLNDASDIYIADTIGELGLWYRLADVVIMGGSFIPHGGQNPIEAIRLGRAVIIGPHYHNFESIIRELHSQYGIIRLNSSEPNELITETADLLTDNKKRKQLNEYAKSWLDASPPVAKTLTEELLLLEREDT